MQKLQQRIDWIVTVISSILLSLMMIILVIMLQCVLLLLVVECSGMESSQYLNIWAMFIVGMAYVQLQTIYA